MEYFKKLEDLLKLEREEDKRMYAAMAANASVAERRDNGLCWYPVAIRDKEFGKGDYLTVELERTTHQDLPHQLRSGVPAAFFSNHAPRENRAEGIVTWVGGNKLRLSLRTDELPDWARDGKLGVDLLFDDNSYDEMQSALQRAAKLAENAADGRLVRVLTGAAQPAFSDATFEITIPSLNPSQQQAVQKIVQAEDLAIVHGPPGTGKTTTLVQAIKVLVKNGNPRILVTAPSNAAVDLLSERLAAQGLNVLRIGNPARVSERLSSLTLDEKMSAHPSMKEIGRLKKQANEFRNMAHKYKRQFGKAEREQRKALFDEAYALLKQVDQTEQYILQDLLNKAQVITATLVGAANPAIRSLRYDTVVIDEAGQALEPACWIPIVKTRKLVLAGDHCQLPPTVKAAVANGLEKTLMEKLVAIHPSAVVMLNEQYRMHEQIMHYSSAHFYHSALQAHQSVKDHRLFPDDQPLLFVDTAGCGFDEKQDGTATSNPEEGAFLYRHLNHLVKSLSSYDAGNFPSIGIISPYRRQVEWLQDALNHQSALAPYRSSITVNTIDSFQGQERDIIYISLTRSNTENRIGFLTDIRRMNVAMTRARKKLVVIGDSATLSQYPFYAGFISYAEEQNAYQSAWELIED